MQSAVRKTPFALALRSPTGYLAAVALALSPAILHAQSAARNALAMFPADTQQIAFINLGQLRSMGEYPQIHRQLFLRQLLDFQDFLRMAGMDPEKEIDELVLGWRGETVGGTGFLGFAEGRFDSQRLRRFFVSQELPIREYGRYELYAFESGGNVPFLYFTFLDSSTAAFGRRGDLRALLDVRDGARAALEANAALTEWVAELEGTSPQWGVSIGRAATNHAAPWLAAGAKLVMDANVFAGSLLAVLYRIDWGSSTTTHVSLVCRTTETAAALSALLKLWRDSNTEATFKLLPAPIVTMLTSMEIDLDGNRILLTASAPLEVIEQIVRGAAR
jgi:hypothetical protein